MPQRLYLVPPLPDMADDKLEADDPRVITLDPMRPEVVPPQDYTPSEFIEDIFGRCEEEHLIAFGSLGINKEGDKAPLPLAPIPIKEWRQWFPEIQRHDLQQTQYMVFNPLHPRAALGKPTQKFIDAMKAGRREYFYKGQPVVSALSTLLIDLDVGRPGTMTAGAALAITLDMAERGEIPWPSMYAYSGRGIYVLWLIRQESSYRPPPKTDDNIKRTEMVMGELLRRLKNLEVDYTSKDYSKWFKRHGTIDSKTGRRVTFVKLFPDGRPALYTLEFMLGSLGLHYAPVQFDAAPMQTAIEADGKPVHKKKAGAPALQLHEGGKVPRGAEPADCRKRDLEKLLPHIRQVGHRHLYLWYYFNAVYRLYRYINPEGAVHEAAKHTLRLNAALQKHGVTPLPESAVQKKIAERPKGHWRLFRRETVINNLKITPEVAEAYNLGGLIPPALKKKRDEEKAQVASAEAELRERIDAALIESGGRRGLTEIADALGTKRQNVYARRKALGLAPPKSGQTDLLEDS